MPISIDTFFLDPTAQGTLQSQIQQMVAEGILSGRFRPCEKLPSSRKLANHLNVSRITVTLAYTELLADDYLTSRGRSGYFVSENAPQPPDFPPRAPRENSVDWSRAIGQRFSDGLSIDKPQNWQKFKYPFIYGQTDENLFDSANWRLCALRALGKKDFSALTTDYFDHDDPILLEFIARHTLPRRGILAQPEEILVTLGAQNALWLTAQVLLTQRRTAGFENPSYPYLREILNQSRCHLAPVDIDDHGLDLSKLPSSLDVLFATPSHQCPTSATLPIDRRKELLARAIENDFIIVEDDYEIENSFRNAPSPALKSLDKDGRVIYVGSFSKSLFPGLRLGYLVGPEPFIREARALRATVLRHPPGLIQRTAAYFLSLGHYDALIRRTSKSLHKRREIMTKAIEESKLTLANGNTNGGSSFWMRAPDHVDTEKLAQTLRDQGVLIEAGSAFFDPPERGRNFYRLAYSSIHENLIPEGVSRIAQAIETFEI